MKTIDERAYKARNSHIIKANTEFAQGESSGFVKGYCVCANEQKAIDIKNACEIHCRAFCPRSMCPYFEDKMDRCNDLIIICKTME